MKDLKDFVTPDERLLDYVQKPNPSVRIKQDTLWLITAGILFVLYIFYVTQNLH